MANEEGLSKRAKSLLERVKKSGRFYPVGNGRVPVAMKELEKAGLVKVMGRITVITACYVPVGAKPFQFEEFPNGE